MSRSFLAESVLDEKREVFKVYNFSHLGTIFAYFLSSSMISKNDCPKLGCLPIGLTL